MSDLEPLAWAIGVVGVVACLFVPISISEIQRNKYEAEKYSACVQYHSPEECK